MISRLLHWWRDRKEAVRRERVLSAEFQRHRERLKKLLAVSPGDPDPTSPRSRLPWERPRRPSDAEREIRRCVTSGGRSLPDPGSPPAHVFPRSSDGTGKPMPPAIDPRGPLVEIVLPPESCDADGWPKHAVLRAPDPWRPGPAPNATDVWLRLDRGEGPGGWEYPHVGMVVGDNWLGLHNEGTWYPLPAVYEWAPCVPPDGTTRPLRHVGGGVYEETT